MVLRGHAGERLSRQLSGVKQTWRPSNGAAANIPRRTLEPVDRAEEIPLSDRHAAMTQDVIRRRYEEEEIRQGKLLQIVVALHFPVVATTGPGDDLVLRAVDLRASQGLHEAQGGFDAGS